MLTHIIILSLIITAIHVSMWEGMIFHFLARWIDRVLDKANCNALRKPLFECLICMGGIYTLALYPALYGLNWGIVPTMLGVIGLNTIISAVICRLKE